MPAGDIIGEALVIHRVGTPKERRERVAHLFQRVGLRPELTQAYPHEFSGGQRQPGEGPTREAWPRMSTARK